MLEYNNLSFFLRFFYDSYQKTHPWVLLSIHYSAVFFKHSSNLQTVFITNWLCSIYIDKTARIRVELWKFRRPFKVYGAKLDKTARIRVKLWKFRRPFQVYGAAITQKVKVLKQNESFFFITVIENGEEFSIQVCFNVLSFSFFSQNLIGQIIIGLGWIIYHIKAVSVVIRTIFKKFLKCSWCWGKPV